MISLFIENLALGLLRLFPVPGFADFIISILDPLYRWALENGL